MRAVVLALVRDEIKENPREAFGKSLSGASDTHIFQDATGLN